MMDMDLRQGFEELDSVLLDFASHLESDMVRIL
jgi:hypothetical protein